MTQLPRSDGTRLPLVYKSKQKQIKGNDITDTPPTDWKGNLLFPHLHLFK